MSLYAILTQSTQADPTTLTTSDYSAITLDSAPEGASRKSWDDFRPEGYKEFALNTTGRGWISKTGYTLFAIRNDYDVDNIEYTGGWGYNRVAMSESAGTSQDPYLDVTYSDVQVARPNADVTDGSWTNESGSAVNLYASIDEAVASDTDYIQSSLSSGDTCEFSLSTLTDPQSASGHTVYIRYKSNSANCGVVVRLIQGTTIIAERTYSDIPTEYTNINFTLSESEANSITDYSDLRIRFTKT